MEYHGNPVKAQSPFADMAAFLDYQDAWFDKKIYKDLKNGLVNYELWPHEGHTFAKVSITYDKKSFLLRKIEYWYRQGEGEITIGDGTRSCDKMEITFTLKDKPKSLPEEFNLSKFVTCHAGKCTPSPKYKDFHFTIRN